MKISRIEFQAFKWNGEIFAKVFTSGCNCKCRYCFLPELINDHGKLDGKTTIDRIRSNMVMDSVCVTGGEPTIQNDLPVFMKRIKLLGLKTMLETNGTNPDMIEKLMKRRLVDYIRVDIKAKPDKYMSITDCEFGKIPKTLELLKNWDGYWEATTVWHPGITHEDLIEISRIVKDANGKWVILPFVPDNVLDPAYRRRVDLDLDFIKTLEGEIWVRTSDFERRIK